MQYSVEGVSAQNRRYLNAYFGLKFLNLNDLVAVLIQDIIEQQNTDKMFTHTPLLENGVNSNISIWFTHVYSTIYSKISKKRSIL